MGIKISGYKRPKLNLKRFSGDPLAYQSFWDSFQSAVHNEESLDDIVKFNYLKGQLDGRAALAIEGLALTAANYREAVRLLEERFGDEQMIVGAHMDALFALEPLQTEP